MNRPSIPLRRPGAGFTLLELMIALAIIAVIAAVAYPSYQSSVRKGRRADAADAAATVLQAQERWRSNNAQYASSLSTIGVPSTGQYYGIALSGATASGYTVTLTATGTQTKDTGCTTLTVTVAAGNPTYTPAACWSR